MKPLIWFTWRKLKEIYNKRMKKILLSFFALYLSAQSFGQCDPSAYDWAGAAFGVSPNPTIGEAFDNGVLDQPYTEQIYVKAPTLAGDIPGAPALFAMVPIDSLSLTGIQFSLGGTWTNLSVLGLTVTCNNAGVSPIECNFYPGGSYCGDISGTPTIAGTFPVKIDAIGYVNFFGSQAIPYSFENYQIIITDGTVNIQEQAEANVALSLSSAQPNPANNNTVIHFDLPQSGSAQVLVYNLLGETVLSRTVNGKKGTNTFTIETENWKNGVYLYSLQVGDKRITKKLMVQH